MNPQELRRKAAEAKEQVLAIVQAAETENRELNEAEEASAADLRKQAEGFEKRAKVLEDAQAAVAATRQSAGRAGDPIVVGARIEGVQSEEDKHRSFGNLLLQIAMVGDPKLAHRDHERAWDLLTNQYRSQYRAWDTPEKRALSATTGSSGGFTMPKDMYTKLMQLVSENAIVRPRATKVPMGALSIPIPMLDQSGTPPTDGSALLGGISLGWTGEEESKPATAPKFNEANLEAKELTGTCPVSRVLLQLSVISVDALLFDLFAKAVAWTEDYAFFLGNKPTRPRGIIPSGALLKTADRGSATVITFANIVACFVKMLPACRGNAVFVGSQAAESAILNATGAANSVFIPSGLVPVTAEQAGAALNYGVFGRPILVSEKLPALNTVGDFGFYDFSQYLVGDPEMSMEIAASEHSKFGQNQIEYRLVHYVAGMPWLRAAITYADGTTQGSPFVALLNH